MDDPAAILTIVTPFVSEWDLLAVSAVLVSHSENIVYKLLAEDKKHYALRVHRQGYHALEELNSEQMWTGSLHDFGISVPQVRRRNSGEYYKAVQIEGETRYLGIVEWLDGQVLYETVEKSTEANTLIANVFELGEIMAQMHNQATAWEIPRGFDRVHWNVDGFFGQSPHWGKFWETPQLDEEQRQTIMEVREYLMRRLRDYGERPQTYSMIHADMHDGNLMKVDDHITVIDFDDAGFGWHLYDMAVAIYQYQDRANFSDIEAAMVEGYRRYRDLEEAEVARLPDFLLLRNVAMLGWIGGRPELDHGGRLPSIVNGICRAANKIGIAA